jgi:hypothetical protein
MSGAGEGTLVVGRSMGNAAGSDGWGRLAAARLAQPSLSLLYYNIIA